MSLDPKTVSLIELEPNRFYLWHLEGGDERSVDRARTLLRQNFPRQPFPKVWLTTSRSEIIDATELMDILVAELGKNVNRKKLQKITALCGLYARRESMRLFNQLIKAEHMSQGDKP